MNSNFPYLICETIEIDPNVTEIARKYFGFQTSNNSILHIEDATNLIPKLNNTYDAIIMDAYSETGISLNVVSQVFLQVSIPPIELIFFLTFNLKKATSFPFESERKYHFKYLV